MAGGAVAAASATAAAAASQMTGLISEVSNSEFEKLIDEKNAKPSVGKIKTYGFLSPKIYKIAIIAIDGVNIVSFYPLDAQINFKYSEIGELMNPRNIIVPKAQQIDTEKVNKVLIIWLVVFPVLVLCFGLIIMFFVNLVRLF